MKQLFFILLSITFGVNTLAQDTTTSSKPMDNGMIDFLKRDGRIYTVITVVCIILIGIFYYLWRIDKKITRLENKQ